MEERNGKASKIEKSKQKKLNNSKNLFKSIIVDIELTLDADYVCDSYNDVLAAALDVQKLLNETYGMNTIKTTIFSPSNDSISGYEVTGTIKYKKKLKAK